MPCVSDAVSSEKAQYDVFPLTKAQYMDYQFTDLIYLFVQPEGFLSPNMDTLEIRKARHMQRVVLILGHDNCG